MSDFGGLSYVDGNGVITSLTTAGGNLTTAGGNFSNDYLTLCSNGYASTVAGGGFYQDNNKENSMEIGKKEKFKIVLRETVIKDYTYDILAKDKEDALEIIKDKGVRYVEALVSVDVIEVK